MLPRYTGILLSAGESRRMGRPKALLTLGGRTFFREACEAMRAAGLATRVAVVPPGLAEELRADAAGADLLANGEPERGQIHSLKMGLAWIIAGGSPAQPLDGAFVLLVDNPGDLTDRLRIVAEAVARDPGLVYTASHGGEPGHPLWLPARLWARLLDWDGPGGTRGFLEARGEPVTAVETAFPSALHDIDTPGDYSGLPG